jgi:hypothetical protein
MSVERVDETISEFSGWVTFNGTVRNNGNNTINFPRMIMTFKKDGKIIEIETVYLEGLNDNMLSSGEMAFFEELVLLTKDEYDKVTYRFEGRNEALDPRLINGDIEVVSESLNIVEFIGDAAILGEFSNGTNAVINEIEIRFAFYDPSDNLIGVAEVSSFSLPDEVYPGEIISFRATSNASVDDISRWEVSWSFVSVRLFNDIPTVVENHSWGKIKSLR